MIMQHSQASVAGDKQAISATVKLYTWAAIILIAAELIGAINIPLGPGKVVLLPMVWALVLGAVIGIASRRMPGTIGIDYATQLRAASILQPALLIFIAKLGLVVGGSLPVVFASGWALLFQEFGHFVGTVVLGLPVALMLGIKREAIGATFSVGREPSLAIIGERYGMDSPEGRGVLAEYLTGTLFGALFIAIVAGFITSLGIFHPNSLAMGSGIGSGSMMAAAAGAIAAQQTPEVAKEVMTLAAASNLITTTIGTYFTLFISLPLAVWGYRVLEPLIGRTTKASITSENISSKDVSLEVPDLSWAGKVSAWLAAGALALIANYVGYKTLSADALTGMGIMIFCAFAGELLCNLLRRKIPAVCMVSLVAMFLTSPACPFAAEITRLTSSINMLAVITPMLTFAGLSIAKDLPAFRRLGWRIVLVSFLANFGTFIGAVLIAEMFH
ncbi:Membrane protein [Pseudomonas cichorii]|uniref:Membrane protein n=2 Tax=Pseudomonas cichorii TaxID=36746 RepID=A0A3M4M0I8_PSECI|nr:Membrane protein [Pseudomonas cichorii]